MLCTMSIRFFFLKSKLKFTWNIDSLIRQHLSTGTIANLKILLRHFGRWFVPSSIPALECYMLRGRLRVMPFTTFSTWIILQITRELFIKIHFPRGLSQSLCQLTNQMHLPNKSYANYATHTHDTQSLINNKHSQWAELIILYFMF